MSALSEAQLDRFRQDGYLVVEGVLPHQDLSAVWKEYGAILDTVTRHLVEQGELEDRPRASTFEDLYLSVIGEVDDMYDVYQHLDVSLPLVEPFDESATMNAGPAVFGLLTHERVLDLVEAVIGPEIYSNPVQHTRIKPPATVLPRGATDANIARTMWHQDRAVLEAEAAESNILTVWLAITDATIDNGCLTAVPGSHRSSVSMHCPGKVFPAEIYIPEEAIDTARVVPLEVGSGGVVLLHRLTQHASLENNSDSIRWSFDLRYQPPDHATGRPYFPGFLARSAQRPDDVMIDHLEWASSWRTARDRLTSGQTEFGLGDLWGGNASHPLCA